jgi:hypothetical protein
MNLKETGYEDRDIFAVVQDMDGGENANNSSDYLKIGEFLM